MAEAAIFEPLADDNHAAPLSLIEVATIKPSGYLYPRGIVSTDKVDEFAEAINAYFAEKGRNEPIVYVRAVGTQVWVAQTTLELNIPNVLPDDFA